MSLPGPTLSMIYARSEDRCIGRDGGLPWRLPEEFQHFKKTTMGCPILMGRRTYEDHDSALPGRLNIVITRQPDYRAAEGVVVAGSLEDAMRIAQAEHNHVFIIGGAGIFARGYEIVDRVYETVVHTKVPDGDAYLPEFDFSGWTKSLLSEHPIDARHAHAFTITRYDRA